MDRKVEDLYVGEDFHTRGEYAGGFLFLHCDMFIHNKSTVKKMKATLAEIIQMARQMGYDKPVFSYAEDGRLSRIMGGTYSSSFEQDGRIFEVYIWD